jgi:hypothetical protein
MTMPATAPGFIHGSFGLSEDGSMLYLRPTTHKEFDQIPGEQIFRVDNDGKPVFIKDLSQGELLIVAQWWLTPEEVELAHAEA